MEWFGFDCEILASFLHKVIRDEIDGRVVIRWSLFLRECKKVMKNFRFRKLKIFIGVLVDETALVT